MRNKRLQDRIGQARAVIGDQIEKDDRGIFMIKASVFRCFLGLLEKDAGLIEDDLGATTVWNWHLLESGFGLSEDRLQRFLQRYRLGGG